MSVSDFFSNGVRWAIGIGVSLLLFLVAQRRDREKHKKASKSKLRSAFSETLAKLQGKQQDPWLILKNSSATHDAAIAEFRKRLRGQSLERFDALAEKYHSCRSALQPAMLEFVRSQATGQSIDQSATSNPVEVINELLDFADKT